MQHINLETFANGAFTAQVNRAIEEVTKNIQDPNTDAGTARKITVTIAFKPNQERNFIATGVQTKSSYVFRIQDSDRGPSFKLVEADGGLWKNATMKKIKEYLAYELAEELEKYNITIIA